MQKQLLLLAAIIALFLATSLVLHVVYGPSFPFLPSEDCWVPDDHGGWLAHGHPSAPQPTQPSVHVPLLFNYLPIFLPGALLVVFMFTPLRRRLETKKVDPKTDSSGADSERTPNPE